MVGAGTVGSLIFCAVTCVLWVRSHSGGESLERLGSNWRTLVISDRGFVGIRHMNGPYVTVGDPPSGSWIHLRPTFYQPSFSGDRPLGFNAGDVRPTRTSGVVRLHERASVPWPDRERWVTVPYWSLALAFVSVPLAYVLMRVARARRGAPAGCCGACGYDLRASPGRCPECGKVSAGASRPAVEANRPNN
jgi:hypothetical protein